MAKNKSNTVPAKREYSRKYSRKYYVANRDKALAASRRWREANPERQRAAVRKWDKANPEKKRAAARRWRGLPEPTRPCPELCECCNRAPATHLDHDHTTGEFRGWLCNSCNLAIGRLGDTVTGVRQALDYVVRNTPAVFCQNEQESEELVIDFTFAMDSLALPAP